MRLVKEIFCEEDARLIAKIPLSKNTKPDRLIWMDSITGQFTIKSAYYVARTVLGREQLPRKSRPMVWRTLWMAKVAHRIKNFGWRLFHSILPTRMMLREKGVIAESNCVVCGNQRETIKHVFF